MDVVMDGIIYHKQPHGGISRLYSAILPRMCDLEQTLQVDLFLSRHCQSTRQSLPEHRQIQHRTIPTMRFAKNRYGRGLQETVNILMRSGAGPLVYRTGKGRIWHSTYYTQPAFWRGARVTTVYDMVYSLFPDLFPGVVAGGFRKMQETAIKKADVVICISEATRRTVEDIHGVTSSYVIPLGASPHFYVDRQESIPLMSSLEKPFVLYLGLRAPHKNFDRLLQVFSIWKKSKEVTLVVAGASWTETEKQRLMELGIQDIVHLLTNVDDDTLRCLYNQAAAFIYPSLYEGFGIPLLEAMACGCPIIASNIPSTLEVAGDYPVYFEPESVESLVTALDEVFVEGKNLERVKTGLEHIKQYSWDRTAKETLSVYRSL